MFTFPLTTKTKLRVFWIFTIVILMTSGLKVFAQPPIPANNDDLDNIIQKIDKFTKLAQRCASFDCPDFDCDTAQKVFNNQRDARKYMRYTHFWLKLNAKTQMDLLLSLSENGQITSDQMARIQWIVDMQETTKVCAGAVLDIASGLANIKELFEDINNLEDVDVWEGALDLFKTLEIAKDFEQVLDAYTDKGEEPMLDIFNMDNEVINDAISHLADLATVANEVRTRGGSIKDALTNAKSKIGILSIAGRLLKSKLEADIKDREKYIQERVDDLKATNAAQSNIFDGLYIYQNRRNKAEDAFNALDDLIVLKSESSGAFTRCLLKSENNCPLLNFNYVSPVNIPDEHQIFNIRDIDAHKPLKIGEALRYFNAKLLNEVPNLLTDVVDIKAAPAPELKLGNTTFEPGEAFDVEFTVSHCFGSGSWAGIVPYDTPRGNELVNRRAVIGLRSIVGNRTSGTFNLKAPDEEGYYDVRLNNSLTGDEARSITINVEKSTEVSGTSIKTDKQSYITDEPVEYSYGIQLEGNLQGRQTAIVLAKASSGVQSWLNMSMLTGDELSGNESMGKLESGSYEIRILLMVPPSSSNGNMFEDEILSKYSFEVEKDEDAMEPEPEPENLATFPAPEGWAKGTLYNTNTGDCRHGGKYLIFMNAIGGRFKNLRTGEINQYMVVGPGEKLEVAAPERSAFIRVFTTSTPDTQNSEERISYGTISQLVDGWWFQAGCKSGSRKATNCDNGKGHGPSTPFSCTTLDDQ